MHVQEGDRYAVVRSRNTNEALKAGAGAGSADLRAVAASVDAMNHLDRADVCAALEVAWPRLRPLLTATTATVDAGARKCRSSRVQAAAA